MALTFGGMREGRIRWRRELPPVIAVAGLAADYLSPAALWTILLPLGAVVLLLAMRKWAVAATVFLLSSWMLIPVAVHTVAAVEERSGEQSLWLMDDGEVPERPHPPGTSHLFSRSRPLCPPDGLPIGPGHLFNPRWAMRDAVPDLPRPAQRDGHRPPRPERPAIR